jgi:hypothetical protein
MLALTQQQNNIITIALVAVLALVVIVAVICKAVKNRKPAPAPVVKQEPTPAPKPEPAPAPKRRFSMLRLIIKLAVFAAIITVLQMFVIGFPKVSMNSMDPLISSGDRLAVSKMAKNLTKGDVIVFKGDNGKNLAARIVAVK